MIDTSKEFAVFDKSAEIYDLIYDDKDTSAETLWIATTLERHGCKPGGTLLEFGSGTGRHARLLADRGYKVTGVEPSAEMLERAEPQHGVTFIQGDTSSTILHKKFDAVLALFHVMSYHTEIAQVHQFFSTACDHLDAGGLFAFDVWYSPAVHSLEPETRVLEKANSRMSIVRKATPSEDISQSLVTVSYLYQVNDLLTGERTDFTESHPMRHFSQTEIELLSAEHGFELLESCEFMSDAKPSRETWGVWFTLRKM